MAARLRRPRGLPPPPLPVDEPDDDRGSASERFDELIEQARQDGATVGASTCSTPRTGWRSWTMSLSSCSSTAERRDREEWVGRWWVRGSRRPPSPIWSSTSPRPGPACNGPGPMTYGARESEEGPVRWPTSRSTAPRWCPDCRRAKKFLSDQRVAFTWHDIDGDDAGLREVETRNDGKRIIPTVVFADGSHLAEPSNEELADKLGLARSAMQHVYDLVIVGGGPTRPHYRDLRGAREPRDPRDRFEGPRRPGRGDGTSRQLPRLPGRDRRRRARQPVREAGGALRRRASPGRQRHLDH